MKYRFPNIDIVQKHLLSSIYQEEDFHDLVRINVKQIDSLVKNSSDNEFKLSESKYYNDSGHINALEIFDESALIKEEIEFQFDDRKITSKTNDEKIIWRFNADGFLIREEHIFSFDRPTVYDFQLDNSGNLLAINDVRFTKSDGCTVSVISVKSNKSLFADINFDKQSRSISFTENGQKNTVILDKYSRVVKRIDDFRINEAEYDDDENWQSYITLEGQQRRKDFSKSTEIIGNIKTAIETKYKENGDVEYEFKEVLQLS